MKRLTDLFGIRPNETRLAGLIVALMLLTALGSGIGTSGVEALFFARLGTSSLPLIYMIQGVLTLVVTLAVSGLSSRFSRSTLYLLLPIAMTAILVGERVLSGLTWFLPVMWLLKEIINALIGFYVWGVASALCDTRQAKRLYPLFNAGRILGSVIGGLGTAPLVNSLGTENLLLVWAGTMAVAVLVTRLLVGPALQAAPPPAAQPQGPGFIQEVQQGFRFVRGSTLMRWVSVAAILFSALYFSLALPFSKAAASQFPSEAALAGFLGLFQALSTAAAFLASLFIANRFYARFGVMNAILALPLIYLVGFGVLALVPAFPVLVVYKFIQMLWLSGMADSAYQAMFNSVPGERRDQVRAFVDGVPSQAGTFIAGFILIVGEQRMDSQQLYIIGLALGLACSYVIWQAARAYSGALLAALKAGQPQLFIGGQGWGAVERDATAIAVVLDGLTSPDVASRRVAAEILGSLALPQSAAALRTALQDSDAQVRALALQALAALPDSESIPVIHTVLADSDPEVRLQAVLALSKISQSAPETKAALEPLLADPVAQVRIQAAAGLLRNGPHAEARDLLRAAAALGQLDERVFALTALGDLADADAMMLIGNELEDETAPISVRCAAARALRHGGTGVVPLLIATLSAVESSLRSAAAESLSYIGPSALPATLAALNQPATEHGAVHALEGLPVTSEADALRRYARQKVENALRFHAACVALVNTDDNRRLGLLADSLRAAAQWQSLHALRAINLLDTQRSLSIVMDNLRSPNAGQRANALETLESVREAPLLRPMLKVWEDNLPADPTAEALRQRDQTLAALLTEPDPWVRACTVLVLAAQPQTVTQPLLAALAQTDPDPLVRSEAQLALNGDSMNTLNTLSLMERIMFLRRVPIFAALPPTDLKQVGAIASEMLFSAGDLLGLQGEVGHRMFIIVNGEVAIRVKTDDKPEVEIARRKAGDSVGEMAIISQEPRNASLLALGEVRTLCIDYKAFDGLLRERPEVSLAVMRVLCARITELSK